MSELAARAGREHTGMLRPARARSRAALSHGKNVQGISLRSPLQHQCADRLVELLVRLSRHDGRGDGREGAWVSQTVGDLKLHRTFLLLDTHGYGYIRIVYHCTRLKHWLCREHLRISQPLKHCCIRCEGVSAQQMSQTQELCCGKVLPLKHRPGRQGGWQKERARLLYLCCLFVRTDSRRCASLPSCAGRQTL